MQSVVGTGVGVVANQGGGFVCLQQNLHKYKHESPHRTMKISRRPIQIGNANRLYMQTIIRESRQLRTMENPESTFCESSLCLVSDLFRSFRSGLVWNNRRFVSGNLRRIDCESLLIRIWLNAMEVRFI